MPFSTVYEVDRSFLLEVPRIIRTPSVLINALVTELAKQGVIVTTSQIEITRASKGIQYKINFELPADKTSEIKIAFQAAFLTAITTPQVISED
jgi:hypothetical protein